MIAHYKKKKKKQGYGRKYTKTGKLATTGSLLQSKYFYEISKSS